MQDSFGRTIDYLRISLTDKCNLRCIYCMPEEGVSWQSHDLLLRIEEIARFVRIAASLGVRKVRLTGGEPLVRKGIVDLIALISAIPEIEDISLTTNGILLPKMAADLKEAGLSRVNISLDTLDPVQYTFITRGGRIEDVFAAIDAALEFGFDPVKINAVAVRSLDQDFLGFASLSVNRPLHVRFIEYMPVGESSGGTGAGWTEKDSIPVSELIDIINEHAICAGLSPLEAVDETGAPGGSGPAVYYRFPGAQGTVGFISAMSNHFCATCNRLRLTADGKIRPCLFSDKEVDVRAALRGEAADAGEGGVDVQGGAQGPAGGEAGDAAAGAAGGEAADAGEGGVDVQGGAQGAAGGGAGDAAVGAGGGEAGDAAGDEAVLAAIREAVGIKPDEHGEERGTERRMSQIGG